MMQIIKMDDNKMISPDSEVPDTKTPLILPIIRRRDHTMKLDLKRLIYSRQ